MTLKGKSRCLANRKFTLTRWCSRRWPLKLPPLKCKIQGSKKTTPLNWGNSKLVWGTTHSKTLSTLCPLWETRTWPVVISATSLLVIFYSHRNCDKIKISRLISKPHFSMKPSCWPSRHCKGCLMLLRSTSSASNHPTRILSSCRSKTVAP